MHITRSDHHVTIDFGSTIHRRAKVLFLIEAAVAAVGAVMFFYFSVDLLNSPGDYIIASMVTGAIGLVFSIAAFRYLNKVFNREYLHISRDTLQIISKNLFDKTVSVF